MASARLNLNELRWAAGFFDGEGSAVATYDKAKDLYYMRVAITQAEDSDLPGEPPEVLRRFYAAVLGLGNLWHKPNYDYDDYNRKPQWEFNTGKFEYAQAIICFLFPFLSKVKRAQAIRSLGLVSQQPDRRRLARGKPKLEICKNNHDPSNWQSHTRPDGHINRTCRLCKTEYMREWRRG